MPGMESRCFPKMHQKGNYLLLIGEINTTGQKSISCAGLIRDSNTVTTTHILVISWLMFCYMCCITVSWCEYANKGSLGLHVFTPYIHIFNPCTNFPLYFEWSDSLTSSAVWKLPTNHEQVVAWWLLDAVGPVLLRGVVFSEKAFQHSGRPTW